MPRLLAAITSAAVIIISIVSAQAFFEGKDSHATITRINTFTAQPGQSEAVKRHLVAAMKPIEQAKGYILHKVLSGIDEPETIIVIEKWESISDHQAAAAAISSDDIEALMAMLAAPPSGGYYQE